VRPDDRGLSPLSDRSRWSRYLLVVAPLVLLDLHSWFRESLLQAAATLAPSSPQDVYWAARALLGVAFLAALLRCTPEVAPRPMRPDDPYEGERAKRDPLLGLRALACLNVFFGHWFLVVFGPPAPAQTSGELALRIALSFSPWCGVWMFFTLSGYLMAKGFVTGRHATDRRGLKAFYLNRVLRIFPVYFTAVLVVAALVSPASLDLTNAAARSRLFQTALFDQQEPGVIGALWSVSTEFQFYLAAPFLYLALSPLASRPRALLAFGGAVPVALGAAKYWLLVRHPTLWNTRVYFPMVANLDCFLAGMVTAFLVNRWRLEGRSLVRGLTAGVAGAVLAQVLFSTWSFHEMSAYQGFPGSATRQGYLAFAPGITALATSVVILLFEVSRREPSPGATLAWRASTFLGSITYCLYVLHEPVVVWLRSLHPGEVTLRESLLLFPAGALASVGVAYLFYRLVETPFDRLRGRGATLEGSPRRK
jgi:peptidoglycan/LPS O-acetylase OafA/YrhL